MAAKKKPMDDFVNKLHDVKPKLVLVGASAYPRKLVFEDFAFHLKKFEDFYGWKPYFMVDMAHIAGLVVSGDHRRLTRSSKE